MDAIAGIEVKGANTWAVGTHRDGDDELASYVLLEGPGIDGVIAPREGR